LSTYDKIVNPTEILVISSVSSFRLRVILRHPPKIFRIFMVMTGNTPAPYMSFYGISFE
jgi:hypothetical protein